MVRTACPNIINPTGQSQYTAKLKYKSTVLVLFMKLRYLL